MTDPNVVTWGHGDPVVMVHGSGPSWGEETWAEQRSLSDAYRLLLIDRRGFGDSPPAEGEDFGVDAEDRRGPRSRGRTCRPLVRRVR
ncbi:MAG TPA: hypothetical protein VFG96_02240 [Jiangellaceae bacterium]|nr:hypothetical protein [Jiangellaceae bacterium]